MKTLLLCLIFFAPVKKSQTPIKVKSYQYELLQLVNQQRAKGCACGSKKYPAKPPLEWNTKLEEASRIQVQYLNNKKVLSHHGSDGKDVRSRLNKVNYSWSAYAENIADGYEKSKEVFDAWMASPGHCKNIMGDYKEMGACKVNEFWVQNFGSQKINE